MVLGNFILPHWKSLWIPFFQVSNFILQSTEKEKFREARIIAANYYTPELIEKIYEQSVSILKVKDFDPEVYKERFSDIEKITLSDIEFLNDKQAEIQKALKMLSEKNDVRKEYKPLIDFTNMVLGRRP